MSFKKAFHFPNTQSIHYSTTMLTNFKTTLFVRGLYEYALFFSKIQNFHSLIE